MPLSYVCWLSLSAVLYLRKGSKTTIFIHALMTILQTVFSIYLQLMDFRSALNIMQFGLVVFQVKQLAIVCALGPGC